MLGFLVCDFGYFDCVWCFGKRVKKVDDIKVFMVVWIKSLLGVFVVE